MLELRITTRLELNDLRPAQNIDQISFLEQEIKRTRFFPV